MVELKVNLLLDCGMYDDAIMLSEFLLLKERSVFTLSLLAKCYFATKQYNQIILLLKDYSEIELRYLVARACFELGLYEECIKFVFNSYIITHNNIINIPTHILVLLGKSFKFFFFLHYFLIFS
jgi:tetratricopeptide (TPR) repeat protein